MKDVNGLKRLLRVSVFFVTSALLACTSEEKKQYSQTPAPTDECGNCGMFVEPFPQWNVRVATQPQIWFCSPRCMFVKQQESQQPDSIFVNDYYDNQRINGRTAYYVIGSDIIGSMGHDLVPFATAAAAADFLKEHRGRRIVQFAEVKASLLDSLTKDIK